MNIPVLKDIIQETRGNLTRPEIRVWVHPKKGGDSYYYVFDTFENAELFIEKNKEEAEDAPLIAFRGYEIHLYGITLKHIKVSKKYNEYLSKKENKWGISRHSKEFKLRLQL